MRNQSKRTLLVAVLILLHLSVLGQGNFFKGEIIQNGVTKSGYIKYTPKANNKGTIRFKENKGDEPVKLTAREIEGFKIPRFNINVISVRSLNKFDTIVFAELLIEGRASLAVNENEHIILLDGKQLNMMIPGEYKRASTKGEYMDKKLADIKTIGKIKSFLPGCEITVAQTKLTSPLLIGMISDYNKCQAASQEKRKSRKMFIEPVIGLTYSKIKMDGQNTIYLANAKFDPSVATNIGINFSFNSGSYLDRSVFSIGFIYNDNTFHGTSYFLTVNNSIHKEKYTINLKRVKVPIMLKKYLAIGQQGFYYGGGITPYIFREFKPTSTFKEYRDGAVVASGSSDHFAERRPYGTILSAIVGYDLLFGKNSRLLIGCSIDYDPGFLARSENYTARVYSYQLNVGIRL